MGGLYRSQDDGANWHLANSGLPEESILGLAVTESGSTRLYAATPSGLYLSNNRADGWSLIGALPIETAQQLLVEPNALGNLLLVAEDAIYRSTNAGVTWVVLDIPAEVSPIRDVMFCYQWGEIPSPRGRRKRPVLAVVFARHTAIAPANGIR